MQGPPGQRELCLYFLYIFYIEIYFSFWVSTVFVHSIQLLYYFTDNGRHWLFLSVAYTKYDELTSIKHFLEHNTTFYNA